MTRPLSSRQRKKQKYSMLVTKASVQFVQAALFINQMASTFLGEGAEATDGEKVLLYFHRPAKAAYATWYSAVAVLLSSNLVTPCVVIGATFIPLSPLKSVWSYQANLQKMTHHLNLRFPTNPPFGQLSSSPNLGHTLYHSHQSVLVK